MSVRRYSVAGPFDLGRTLAPLGRGTGDRTFRFDAGRILRATRTPDGPASMAISLSADGIVVEAFGPGADHALAAVPALVGLLEEPEPILAGHPTIAQLVRRFPGVRIPRSGAVLESLVPAILEQKVIGEEARREIGRASCRERVCQYV